MARHKDGLGVTGLADFAPESALLLVGAGKMGAALLRGWLSHGLDPNAVIVVDPAPPEVSRVLMTAHGIVPVAAPPDGRVPRMVVVAVKPQVMTAVLPDLRQAIGPGTVVLSIAAGTTLGVLEAALGPAAIVRAMPNTPAQVGRGISAVVAGPRVGDADRALVDALLSAVGEVAWLDDEAMMDAVTAVSGSGPAYVFHLAECLAEAGVACGLPPDLAARLARATVEGAGELLRLSDEAPAKLRRNVTSPGGTTEAALAVLAAEDGLPRLMRAAVTAARDRSRALSQ